MTEKKKVTRVGDPDLEVYSTIPILPSSVEKQILGLNFKYATVVFVERETSNMRHIFTNETWRKISFEGDDALMQHDHPLFEFVKSSKYSEDNLLVRPRIVDVSQQSSSEYCMKRWEFERARANNLNSGHRIYCLIIPSHSGYFYFGIDATAFPKADDTDAWRDFNRRIKATYDFISSPDLVVV